MRPFDEGAIRCATAGSPKKPRNQWASWRDWLQFHLAHRAVRVSPDREAGTVLLMPGFSADPPEESIYSDWLFFDLSPAKARELAHQLVCAADIAEAEGPKGAAG